MKEKANGRCKGKRMRALFTFCLFFFNESEKRTNGMNEKSTHFFCGCGLV